MHFVHRITHNLSNGSLASERLMFLMPTGRLSRQLKAVPRVAAVVSMMMTKISRDHWVRRL